MGWGSSPRLYNVPLRALHSVCEIRRTARKPEAVCIVPCQFPVTSCAWSAAEKTATNTTTPHTILFTCRLLLVQLRLL